MKKAIFAVVAFAVIMFFVSNKRNNDPVRIWSDLFANKVRGATELKYKIYFFGVVPAGEALFSNKGKVEFLGKRLYHLNGIAESSRWFSLIFHGTAQLDSYVDPDSMLPVAFKQKLGISGKADSEKEVTYDQAKNVMTKDGIRREILPRTHDALSLVFSLKNVNFNSVRDIEFNINTHQKNYILHIAAQKKKFFVNGVTAEIIWAKVEVKRRDGNPYHQSSAEMFLWPENNNIPFLIKIFANGIPVTVKLVDVH